MFLQQGVEAAAGEVVVVLQLDPVGIGPLGVELPPGHAVQVGHGQDEQAVRLQEAPGVGQLRPREGHAKVQPQRGIAPFLRREEQGAVAEAHVHPAAGRLQVRHLGDQPGPEGPVPLNLGARLLAGVGVPQQQLQGGLVEVPVGVHVAAVLAAQPVDLRGQFGLVGGIARAVETAQGSGLAAVAERTAFVGDPAGKHARHGSPFGTVADGEGLS